MTIIDRVTMTGADDSIKTTDLLWLTREFPFVEWGILASNSSMKSGGRVRYPSPRWISDLQALAETTGELSRLSLHINGDWVKDLLLGEISIPDGLLHLFARMQLNFHAERRKCEPKMFHASLRTMAGKQFIFQIDGDLGNAHLESLYGQNFAGDQVDAVPLFDTSGGAGRLPGAWPSPVYMKNATDYVYHGYAGGLGPHNLADQLPLIVNAAGSSISRIWIDMETCIRSQNDRVFDLDKVHEALKIVAASGLTEDREAPC